jgi:hypothetical protein
MIPRTDTGRQINTSDSDIVYLRQPNGTVAIGKRIFPSEGGGAADPAYQYSLLPNATQYTGPVPEPPKRSAFMVQQEILGRYERQRNSPAGPQPLEKQGELRVLINRYLRDRGTTLKADELTDFIKKNPILVREIIIKGLDGMGNPLYT